MIERDFCEVETAVCIAHYNETTADLENCVADALSSVPKPQTIVIVDDHSDNRYSAIERLRSMDLVASIEDIRFVLTKTPRRLGAGPAKRYACELALEEGAELLVVPDCHCRMPRHWLAEFVESYLMFPTGIFCPAVQGIDYSHTKIVSAGGRWSPHCVNPDIVWQEYPTGQLIHHCLPTESVLGGCYAISRQFWNVTGGIAPYFIGYGLEEPDMSMRAWLCGFQCYRCCGLMVGHSFNRDMCGYHMNGIEPMVNQRAMSYVLFGKELYENLFRPYLDQIDRNPQIYKMLESIDLDSARSRLLSQSVHQPHELEWLCNYRIPTHEEMRQRVFNIRYNLAKDRRVLEKKKKEEEKDLQAIRNAKEINLVEEIMQDAGADQRPEIPAEVDEDAQVCHALED